ncbi:MAG: ABC transporter ATP-binding protein [Caldiserica bacterium]|nr:ABC transporter ATP-binding protein [Caldisericota bacterium]
MSSAITASNVSRFYGKFEALKDVSFEVPGGSIFGFLGPNGAGKTTTLYVLLGLLPQKTGKVRVLGLDPVTQGDKLRAQVGCLLEESGLYDVLTVKDNLEFFGRAQRMDEATLQSRIKETLEFFELSDFSKTKAGKLSKGMKQKTALARAILAMPKLLFLDEPTANLDPEASVAFRELIVNLARKHGITVFLNTHRLDEAQKICDHIAIIKKGKVMLSGSTADLLNSSREMTVTIKADGFASDSISKLGLDADKSNISDGTLTTSLANRDMVPNLVSRCVGLGYGVYEVKPSTISLEELFVNVMEDSNNVA